MNNCQPWVALMARAINNVMAGRQNTTLAEFTFNANSDTTALKNDADRGDLPDYADAAHGVRDE